MAMGPLLKMVMSPASMRLAKKPRMVLRHSSPYAVEVLQSRGMLVVSLPVCRRAKMVRESAVGIQR